MLVVVVFVVHTGTRSAPREITLDNSIINPKDSDRVRVSTPPRIITLSEHHFPSASEEPEQQAEELDTHSVQSSDDLRSAGANGGGGGRQLAMRPKKLYNPEFSFNQR